MDESRPRCPKCKTAMIGVEYGYPHPEQYDGISEWDCPECGLRLGRWTGRELIEGESEPRYGLPHAREGAHGV